MGRGESKYNFLKDDFLFFIDKLRFCFGGYLIVMKFSEFFLLDNDLGYLILVVSFRIR